MISELQTAKKVVGVKQLRKVLKEQAARKVFFAKNADPQLILPIEQLCMDEGVPVEYVPTMQELGGACGIDVGAAAAAILK